MSKPIEHDMMSLEQYREMKHKEFMEFQKSMPIPGEEADALIEAEVNNKDCLEVAVWDEERFPPRGEAKRMAASKEK